jgi:hypothetical protein
MRLVILVILLSNVQLAICQSDTLQITITEIPLGADESPEYVTACNEERQRAIKDIQAEILKVENYIGLTFEKKDFGFEDFYINYLIANYRIEQQLTGCTSARSLTCYFDEMDKAINEKYGLSFLKNLRGAAQEEYEKFKLFDNEGKKKCIDFAYVYRKVDERASYLTGLKDIQIKLKERIDFKKFNFSNYKLKGFHTEVVVDEVGNVVSCRVMSRNFPADANEAIQKAVKEIGGWKPAKLYGSPVKSRSSFDFLF